MNHHLKQGDFTADSTSSDFCFSIRQFLFEEVLQGHHEIFTLIDFQEFLTGHDITLERGKLVFRRNAQQRKRDGAFYTPPQVARWITQKTLIPGEILTPGLPFLGKTIDPACGGGVFLREAFHVLRKNVRQSPETVLRLLYGIDINPEAVETTKQVLFAEAMETEKTTTPDWTTMSDRIWSILHQNIRRGNPLIDDVFPNEFFDHVIGNPPYRKERHSKNELDGIADSPLGKRFRSARMDIWFYFLHQGLSFLKPGGTLGFILNATWLRSTGARKLIDRLREQARIREIFLLGKNTVFRGVQSEHLILLLEKSDGSSHSDHSESSPPVKIRQLRDIVIARKNEPCFERCLLRRHEKKPQNGAVLHVGETGNSPNRLNFYFQPDTSRDLSLEDQLHESYVTEKKAEDVFQSGGINIWPVTPRLAEMEKLPTLEHFGRFHQGIVENPARVTRAVYRNHESFLVAQNVNVGDGVFVLTEEELNVLDLNHREKTLLRPYHLPGDLAPGTTPKQYLIYSTEKTWPEQTMFPNLARHLSRFRPIMEGRRETRSGARKWWQLHWPRRGEIWKLPKIVIPQMTKRPTFFPWETDVYVPFCCNVFVPFPEFRRQLHRFAKILRSDLWHEWFQVNAKHRGIGLDLTIDCLKRTPMKME